ncbi:MAG: ankyrin repeat domain-containing protein [Psychrobium sp.]
MIKAPTFIAAAAMLFASWTNANPQQQLPQLHQAVIAGDLKQVKQLIANGADINQLDSKMGNAPVHVAAQTDHTDILKYLLDQGAFINLQTPRSGFTPLHKAAWYSKGENIRLLMQYPALNINLKTPGGALAENMVGGWDRNITPQERSRYDALAQLFSQHRQQLNKVIDQQKILNVIDNNISQVNKVKKIKRLLKQGQDVNQRRPVRSDRNDWHTPLLVASREGYIDVVKLLLENGADQTIPGYTMNAIPFHKAGYMGHPEIVSLLLAAPKADQVINAQGPNNGYTPLHDAIWHGNTEAAKHLIDAGARTDLSTYEQDTPQQLAKRYNYLTILALFK